MMESFAPTSWTEQQIREQAQAQGLTLPDACLPGVKANLALLEDRWARVAATLTAMGEAP